MKKAPTSSPSSAPISFAFAYSKEDLPALSAFLLEGPDEMNKLSLEFLLEKKKSLTHLVKNHNLLDSRSAEDRAAVLRYYAGQNDEDVFFHILKLYPEEVPRLSTQTMFLSEGIMKRLLMIYPGLVDHRSEDRLLVTEFFVKRRNREMVEFLLQRYPDCLYCIRFDAWVFDTEMIMHYLHKFPDLFDNDLRIQERLLFHCIASQKDLVIGFVLSKFLHLKDHPNPSFNFADEAAEYNRLYVLKRLIELGFRPPTHAAAKKAQNRGQTELVRYLRALNVFAETYDAELRQRYEEQRAAVTAASEVSNP